MAGRIPVLPAFTAASEERSNRAAPDKAHDMHPAIGHFTSGQHIGKKNIPHYFSAYAILCESTYR